MASVNKFIGIGNLGREPETRYLPNGDAVTNFSLAINEAWKDKQGQKQEHTEWVRCSCFGKAAEIAAEYLAAGSPAYVEGRLRTRKWQDKSGVDRYTTEVVVDRLQLLGAGKPHPQRTLGEPLKEGGMHSEERARPAQSGTFADMDDDIPF